VISTTHHYQFALACARHPGKVVLLREPGGEFYGAFDCLDILERASGLKAKDGYLRVPSFLLHVVISHLLRAGEQVAICEQVEDSL